MATNKSFSFAAFVAYGNNCINNVNGTTPEIQTAFKADLKRAIAHANYPSKDEIGIIDEINDFDMSNTLEQVPKLVSGFMHDEQRSFDLPAPDENTAPATLRVDAVPEKVNEGTIQFGDNKGQTYKSVTAAHDEVKVKSKTKQFKQ